MDATLSARTFGVEFEVILPRTFSRPTAAAELSRRIGKPVDSTFGATGRNWAIHSDGSLRGDGTALEFVSPSNPPLRGEEGLAEVAAVANALRDMGAVVNESCGTHVHLGAQGERLTFFKNVIKIYGRFERAIDDAMALSRHGNDAYYAKSVARITWPEIDRASTLPELSRAITRSSGAQADRYHKVNLTAHAKHGTVEFRQHGGTVDGGKIANWIIRLLQICQAAKEGRVGAGAQIASDYTAFARKTRIVIEMISRPEGATTWELCQAAGAQRMGIKRHARIAGFQYLKRGKRYFMLRGNEAVAATVASTAEGLDELLNATPEQREFWKARREAIAAVRARRAR